MILGIRIYILLVPETWNFWESHSNKTIPSFISFLVSRVWIGFGMIAVTGGKRSFCVPKRRKLLSNFLRSETATDPSYHMITLYERITCIPNTTIPLPSCTRTKWGLLPSTNDGMSAICSLVRSSENWTLDGNKIKITRTDSVTVAIIVSSKWKSFTVRVKGIISSKVFVERNTLIDNLVNKKASQIIPGWIYK